MELKNRERLLALTALLCFGLWASDQLIFTPMHNLWIERAEAIAVLEESLSKGLLLIKREDAMKERSQFMRVHDLPDDVAVAENQVLKSVERWVQTSGLQLTSFKPRWIQEDDDYFRLECRAAAMGDIETVAKFLYELERDSLALKVEEIEIASRDDDGSQLSLGVIFSGLRFIERTS